MPRFLRVGAPGKERPAVLAADNSIRDLSSHIPDFAGEHLGPAVFGKLAKLDLLQLPKLDAGLRVGACVAGTTNFIAIGLNYFDHAREVGMDPPKEPIIFNKAPSCIVGPDGQRLGPGIPGEIWMRGPQIMLGYWNKPEETAKTLTGGWMRSGDIGCMDENGWFYVVDRKKDMISASGFKVWPREVEDALMEHPAVREAAVIGIPHPELGEEVAAAVALKPGATAKLGYLRGGKESTVQVTIADRAKLFAARLGGND